MTNEKLLLAIGDIDDAAIRDAREMTGIAKPRGRVSFRRTVTILVAAVMLLALAGTVAAAALGAADWFQAFFSDRTGGELTPGQQGYIEDNAETIGRDDSTADYLVTLESAIYDGRTAVIKLKVTAPEGTVLDAPYYAFRDMSIDAADGEDPPLEYRMSMGRIEDEDDLPNTVDMLLTINFTGDVYFSNLEAWQLRLVNFTSSAPDPETGTINEKVVRSGTWRIDLEFETRDGMVELITEPVDAWGLYDMSFRQDVSIIVTSLRLSAMTMELTYVYPEGVQGMGVLDFPGICVVMKDGTKVHISSGSGDYDTVKQIANESYELAAPISLEEVDYVLLYKDVVIPMVPME